jgi:hypothetical protein
MKTAISANDLALIALQDLRAFPGTEHVTTAYIESADGTWVLMVSAAEGADLGRIQTAVRETERRLQHRYKLHIVDRYSAIVQNVKIVPGHGCCVLMELPDRQLSKVNAAPKFRRKAHALSPQHYVAFAQGGSTDRNGNARFSAHR